MKNENQDQTNSVSQEITVSSSNDQETFMPYSSLCLDSISVGESVRERV